MAAPLVRSTVIATVLQLVMVIAGHYNLSIAALFAVGGMSISAVGGLLNGVWTGGQPGAAATAKGGAIAGGLSALIGIAVSCGLGDVMPSVLLFGTAGSTVAGVIGAFVGRALGSGSRG